MSRRWAVCLERNEIESVKKLRFAAGAEILVQADDIWIRGKTLDEPLALLLRKHPHARRHWILADDQLVRPGERVPHGRLPDGQWQSLYDWIAIEMPIAAFAARPNAKVSIQLVRGTVERESNLLVTDVKTWHSYGTGAPKMRLDNWWFAAAADGRIVVRGLPLPPLPGDRFAEDHGVAVPAGWDWAPPVDADILRELLDVHDQDVALLHRDDSWERIRGGQFVRASRPAIRATAKGFCDE